MFESTFNSWIGIRRFALLFLAACAVCFGSTNVVAQGQQASGFGTDASHRSYLRVPANAPLPATRRITIGVDKSMLIELPVDLENVLVSNPEVVNAVVKSQRQVYLLAKDQGEANAFFMGANGQKVLLLEIVVARDLTAISEALHRLLPGSKITVDTMGDNVVLSGSVMTPLDANRAAELAQRAMKKKDSVVNMLTVVEPAKEQVLLKVTVAEMHREAMRRLGVDFPNGLVQSGNFTFQKLVTNAFPVTGIVAPLGTAGSTTGIGWSSGGNSVSAIIEALERTGIVRTLAEPNLTALSGETASFRAGGEFPIPVAGRDGDIKVEFKEFGVSTKFKPLVLSDGRISLSVAAEVSELTAEGAVSSGVLSIPALKTRKAETTLEMPSGGTLAMAGMLSDDTRQNVDGVPGLKNVPILGQLFRSNDYHRRETELVILVTPYIATHMTKAQASKPDKNFAPASDLKSIFFGHMHRLYGPIGGSLEGEFGFIIAYPDAGTKG